MTNGLPFNILVVEDDSDDRIIIDEAFTKIGYEAEVKKFANGQALLDYLNELEPALYPSLIVLDNSLPGLNAEDLLTFLKKNQKYSAIPVVIYSGTISDAKKNLLMQLGAKAIVEKGNTMQSEMEVAQQLKDIAESEKRQVL